MRVNFKEVFVRPFQDGDAALLDAFRRQYWKGNHEHKKHTKVFCG